MKQCMNKRTAKFQYKKPGFVYQAATGLYTEFPGLHLYGSSGKCVLLREQE